MKLVTFSVVSLFLLVSTLVGQSKPDVSESASPQSAISIKIEDGGLKVFVGDQPFTTFDYSNQSKPVLYPVFGPKQVVMTRNYPMAKVSGEANDHPHHKSIWIGHYLNGQDFWADGRAKIKHVSIDHLDSELATFTVTNHWQTLDDKLVCVEQTKYEFGADATSRWIDFSITFKAEPGDVTFEDTKEGMLAIRTHPDLRLTSDPKRNVAKVFGNARTDAGDKGKAVWGKNAKWMNYFGPINGVDVGLVIFDHPKNFRHPTTWHAREYGLIAANPFGLHYFKGLEKGAGAHTIKKGDQLTFKYRMLFYAGTRSATEIESAFDRYAK